MESKLCKKCNTEKEFAEFAKRATAADGHYPYCKTCVNQYSKDWYKQNKDRLKPIRKAWVEQNRDRMRALLRQWDAANREKRRQWGKERYYRDQKGNSAKVAQWRREHRESVREAEREWRRNNPEKVRAQGRRSYQKHRAKRLAQGKIYRAQNRELHNARARTWRQANPGRCRALSVAKKARKRQATIGDPKTITAYYEHVRNGVRLRCYYCNRVTRREDRHVDHIVPLSRGGAHCVSNLCCACSKCNMEKHTKTDEEYTGQLRLL